MKPNPKLLVEFDVSASIGMGYNKSDYKEIIMREVDMYLSSKPASNIVAGLRDYPNLRRVFLKFNCIRSSEAICERMFSYAGCLFCFILFVYCMFYVEYIVNCPDFHLNVVVFVFVLCCFGDRNNLVIGIIFLDHGNGANIMLIS